MIIEKMMEFAVWVIVRRHHVVIFQRVGEHREQRVAIFCLWNGVNGIEEVIEGDQLADGEYFVVNVDNCAAAIALKKRRAEFLGGER